MFYSTIRMLLNCFVNLVINSMFFSKMLRIANNYQQPFALDNATFRRLGNSANPKLSWDG